MSELPFTCPNCNKRFGFGGSGSEVLLGVVNSLPFTNAPTPCCGTKITGHITRDLKLVLEKA